MTFRIIRFFVESTEFFLSLRYAAIIKSLHLKKKLMNFFQNRFRAFGFAFAGLASAFRNETHVRLHALAIVIVTALGCWLSVSVTAWFMLLTCITLVVCLELVNSALERLCNLVSRDQKPAIKYIKDVAAAAVLVSCIFSLIVAVMVFKPYVCGA